MKQFSFYQEINHVLHYTYTNVLVSVLNTTKV